LEKYRTYNKKNGRYRLEHRYWSTPKSSNFSVPFGVLYRGRVIFLKGDGGIQVKSFRDGMAKIFERSFFFFKDVTKKRALIFF